MKSQNKEKTIMKTMLQVRKLSSRFNSETVLFGQMDRDAACHKKDANKSRRHQFWVSLVLKPA